MAEDPDRHVLVDRRGLLVLFVFFAAMGAFDPAEAVGVTASFAALALLWLVHAWPRLTGRA